MTETKSDLQAVIFDCDGVLVDTEPLHYRAFQEVLGPLGLGHDYECYRERYIGFDDRDAFLYAFKEAGRQLGHDSLQRLVEAKAAALSELIARGAPGFPGVVELVKELREEGVALAVASGALRREVDAFLSSLGLGESFLAIVTADDVRKSKPDPETYLLAIELLRTHCGQEPFEPRNCVAIEDTPSGIHSAKTAGLAVIAVTNSFPEDRLTGADKVIGSLSDLSFQAMVDLLEKRRQEER